MEHSRLEKIRKQSFGNAATVRDSIGGKDPASQGDLDGPSRSRSSIFLVPSADATECTMGGSDDRCSPTTDRTALPSCCGWGCGVSVVVRVNMFT